MCIVLFILPGYVHSAPHIVIRNLCNIFVHLEEMYMLLVILSPPVRYNPHVFVFRHRFSVLVDFDPLGVLTANASFLSNISVFPSEI